MARTARTVRALTLAGPAARPAPAPAPVLTAGQKAIATKRANGAHLAAGAKARATRLANLEIERKNAAKAERLARKATRAEVAKVIAAANSTTRPILISRTAAKRLRSAAI